MNPKTLQIHPNDNVLVALQDLSAGESVFMGDFELTVKEDIPAKHKLAIQSFEKNQEVIMYGLLVGKATQAIPAGGLLSTENIKHQAADFKINSSTYQWEKPDVSRFEKRQFMGYQRPDGQVGTRNYWLVIPLVFCENRNVETIREAFAEELGFAKSNPYKQLVRAMADSFKKGNLAELDRLQAGSDSEKQAPKLFENIDGIKFLTHQGGCGGTRQDSESLCALLAGYINNPNVAGATVLSLGCQNAQVDILHQKLAAINPSFDKTVLVFEQQKSGTEQELLTEAIKETFKALVKANQAERKPAPLSKLTMGLECGGSDGFSGISANPAVGYASDLLVALGGKTMLAEFPELCGVEQELINRCSNEKKAEKFSQLMKSYASRAEAVGSGFDMNPSPGNIKDGLITDAIKSAGAAKKGGNSPVTDVLDYGEYASTPGLNLLCTPGNDVESTTALAGAGSNVILFTTGLGTPTGNPICPVLKISSNHQLAKRMPDIIDINTGFIISGEKSIQEMGEEILEKVIEVASGITDTKAMLLEQDDFIPWKRGVSL
ncbi:MAG TPA: altronate hydrolase [Algoriphagus sp.]|jgi:altronate hydrolase|uniref:UxaA family hydrolase n=2 Tax=Algoriphagus TaxID=246875 RepID=UPI000C43637B|nr:MULTISPECIES: altronate dehydratase family protein [unclassified Algoriphagus]MAL14217.1 altronate hydrolase [Algoriphagus sp.]MAN88114.1 altronate hydrolase [Algoriphagus sp.]QYH37448.1 altronate dehydratase [Algoriphagus sp. NBT04N3]HAD50442.1 altronate hydrolase [Algoriphagus sp.]HCD88915.1 altronate hydrolase [Algoriphagus sp.]|tara:strand:- start:8440 stop:10086 length:1647 start_codon:yes stop_codon:yes gene_type:complete